MPAPSYGAIQHFGRGNDGIFKFEISHDTRHQLFVEFERENAPRGVN